uniref:CWF21 domain-containing protein n=1 Tax=Setaria italica TaxID=4555 RepID=K3XS18_SETIT
MYNGIGLQTPRGSGTSGHVQASKFLAKPRPSSSAAAAAGGYGTPNPPHTGSVLERTRKPNKDILEHDRKRQVELRLLVLRDALEEHGYTEAQIEERVGEARKAAEIEAAAEEGGPRSQGKGYGHGNSSQVHRHSEPPSCGTEGEPASDYEGCSWARCRGCTEGAL